MVAVWLEDSPFKAKQRDANSRRAASYAVSPSTLIGSGLAASLGALLGAILMLASIQTGNGLQSLVATRRNAPMGAVLRFTGGDHLGS